MRVVQIVRLWNKYLSNFSNKQNNKAMKCKDCTMDCPYRTSDGEKECEFQNHIIQLPDEWKGVRIQAAIAAMQGIMNCFGSIGYTIGYNRESIAELAVAQADALIEQLKKK